MLEPPVWLNSGAQLPICCKVCFCEWQWGLELLPTFLEQFKPKKKFFLRMFSKILILCVKLSI